MFTAAKLISLSSPHVIFLCMKRVPEIYFLIKFPALNTVFLTVVLMLYIRSGDLFVLHYIIATLHALTIIFPNPSTSPSQ